MVKIPDIEVEEKRRDVRVPIQTRVNLKFSDKVYKQCDTRNLCICGAWINGAKDRIEGDLCEIEFSQAGIVNNRVLTLKGEVVRVEKQGVALVFYDMNFSSYTCLQTIISDGSEDIYKHAEDFLDHIAIREPE